VTPPWVFSGLSDGSNVRPPDGAGKQPAGVAVSAPLGYVSRAMVLTERSRLLVYVTTLFSSIALLCVVVFWISCDDTTEAPSISDDSRTLSTLRQVDDYPLYVLRYYGDYGFDDYLRDGSRGDLGGRGDLGDLRGRGDLGDCAVSAIALISEIATRPSSRRAGNFPRGGARPLPLSTRTGSTSWAGISTGTTTWRFFFTPIPRTAMRRCRWSI